MRTTRPIATISFNSPRFLATKLNELLDAGRISFWAFCPHKPEDDEAGNKEHCHVYVEPAKMLQSDDLKAELKEYDPEHPDKPKGCLTFGLSKYADWYLYAIHDKRYLASKGQSRRYHYTHDEVWSSDPADLLFKTRTIDLLSLSPYEDILDAQRQGLTWNEYFGRGTIPIQQIFLFQRAWETLQQSFTDRGGRPGHPDNFDPVTGEIFDDNDN